MAEPVAVQVPSQTDKGEMHTVLVYPDGRYECECRGWLYSERKNGWGECYHGIRAKKYILKGEWKNQSE